VSEKVIVVWVMIRITTQKLKLWETLIMKKDKHYTIFSFRQHKTCQHL